MVFYKKLQEIDGKWGDKWVIIGGIEMKQMSIGDENMDKYMTQQSTWELEGDMGEAYPVLFQDEQMEGQRQKNNNNEDGVIL